MSGRTLTAFYDLSVCPVTYDFVVFMALVEMARRREGCGALRVVIVPGKAEGFRDDDASYTTSHKNWRLWNIVIPSCRLFNDSATLTVCGNRAEAEAIEKASRGPIFPVDYSVFRPVGKFLWSGVSEGLACGEALPEARASAEASKIVREWLASRAQGRKPVTITLRQSRHAAARNSNVDAWLETARRLDRRCYLPIVIPDTEQAFSSAYDGLTDPLFWSAPALNLDLRMALYEQSWLNMMVLNGPGVLCWLSRRARFLMFRILNDEWVNSKPAYLMSLGLGIGSQLPHAGPFQRLVWEPDTLEVVELEFAAMAARIGDAPAGEPVAPDPVNAEPPLAVALRMQATGRVEEATAIYQSIVQKDPKNADAWHLLGIIAHQAERPEVAERMVRRAISLRPNQANYHINLAAVLRKSGRGDEAANSLWRAIALAPEDAGAHADLAELMQAQGDADEARSALETALRLKPDSPEICERAGRVLHALGHAAEAADLFRRAIELRESRTAEALRARAHMSEIPVVTLKSV